ncbi:hypothetical protein [Micromonospora sp. NPDC047074]|uniref:hypothetical protein n=1 Tax=Micromonospora sp. NPDC047074 TaxID=3154339 RepID=UPI0033E86B60
MLGLFLVVLTLPIVALIIQGFRKRTRRLTDPSRRWARAAGCLLLAAAEVYFYGLAHVGYFWASLAETCVSRFGNWNGRYGQLRYWPLERKCSQFVDMVPGYVNPLIVALLVAAIAVAAVAIVQAVRGRRSNSPTPS